MKRGLSRKNIKLLGTVAVFLIIFLGCTMVLVPISQTTSKVTAQIAEMDKANAAFADIKTEYVNIKNNVDKITQIGTSIDSLFPESMDNSQLISIVNKAAVGAGLKTSAITDMKFSPAVKVGSGMMTPITLVKMADNNFALRTMGKTSGLDQTDIEVIGTSTGCKFAITPMGETGYSINLTECLFPVSKIKLKANSILDANNAPTPQVALESSSESKLSKLAFTFNVNGPVGKLSTFLTILKKNVPAISISSMEIAAAGTVGTASTVGTQMKLSAFALVHEHIKTPEERKTK